MKTVKSTIGLAAVCITAAAMADGMNVVSFEKTIAAKDPNGVSAGMCDASIEARRLVDARYVELRDAKMDKCICAANTRLRSGNALAADATMTLLKSMPGGGKIASNKLERRESLRMPSFNECDIAMPKSLDFRVAGDGNNSIAGKDMAMIANMVEKSVTKAPEALIK